MRAYNRESWHAPLRIQPAGSIFHIWSRGNRRQLIFLDNHDRERFLALLHEVALRHSWIVHGYCLMGNHYHLLIETPRADTLSVGMQRLNGVYAQWFNRRHGLDGHLFQGRFQSKRIESDAQLLELYRYIALNPWRAGLCGNPGDWPWSSFRVVLAPVPHGWPAVDPGLVLRMFSPDPVRAREAFQRFVHDGQARAGPAGGR